MHPYDIAQIKNTSPYLREALRKHGILLYRFLLSEVPLKFDWWTDQHTCYYAYYQTPLLPSGPCDQCQQEAYLHYKNPYTSPRVAWCIACIIKAWEAEMEYYDPKIDPESPEYDEAYVHVCSSYTVPLEQTSGVYCWILPEPLDNPLDEL